MRQIFFLLLFLTIKAFAFHNFVIVIASYNNESSCERNLMSALGQDYPNYRIIYINDNSSDQTLEHVQRIIAEHDIDGRVQLIDNHKRYKALANYTNAIRNHTEDNEIIVILDGDDALSHRHVLSILDRYYNDPDIWLTYGQFRFMSNGQPGWCCPMPQSVIQAKAFRRWPHGPSHLRTFYSWLFKRISPSDLMLNGEFFEMTGDLAMMLPMIEMANHHFAFVKEVLYDYNDTNPISDHEVSKETQLFYDHYIRSLPPYEALSHSPLWNSVYPNTQQGA